MQILKVSNFYKNNVIPFLLLLSLFLSFGFGSLIINLTILILLIYFFMNLRTVKIDFLDSILIIFATYLFVSSFINFNYLFNNVSFIKFIFLTLSLKLIFNNINNNQLENLIKICSLFLIFLIFDIFYQKIFGVDVFGFKPGLGGARLSGPFKDKLIPGTLILYLGFYFFLNIYIKFLSQNNFFKQLISLFILFIFTSSILLTGERMNFISSLLSIILIIFFVNKKKLHIFFTLITFGLCLLIILNDKHLYPRYENFILLLKPKLTAQYFHTDEIERYKEENNINKNISDEKKLKLSFLDTTWGAHYSTAFQLFKKKPIFGNGIKSYRDLCGDVNIKSLRKDFRCSTHPHNIHLELLSEIGLIGYSIFLILTLLIFFESSKIIINKKKYSEDTIFLFFSASLIMCITLFFPIKSSGRLSSTFFGSIYWINFAILYGSIFFLKKKYEINLKKKENRKENP